MGTISKVTLRRLNLPLIHPYRLSYRAFDNFEPFLIEIVDSDGQTGFSDVHISPGASSETRKGGWAALDRQIRASMGMDAGDATASALKRFSENKVAMTGLITALEVLCDDPLLQIAEGAELPLLTPLNQTQLQALRAEIDTRISEGFSVFKVKVGKDVAADLARVNAIQDVTQGAVTLRLDANRAYSRADALRFVSELDPEGIELFEQPCDAEDWEANSAVAGASSVPLMLDEPISSLEDIERAAGIPGVGFCKLKLKRFGGLGRLKKGIEAVRAAGMEPVLGDGLGSEIHSWLEACVARTTISNTGEFNGFLKPTDRLFENPLPFWKGSIRLPAGYKPTLDQKAVERLTVERISYTH